MGTFKKKVKSHPVMIYPKETASLHTHTGTEIHNVRSGHPVVCDILALRQVCWVRTWYSSAKKNLTL